jgi:hypothetical protein
MTVGNPKLRAIVSAVRHVKHISAQAGIEMALTYSIDMLPAIVAADTCIKRVHRGPFLLVRLQISHLARLSISG